MSDGKDELPFAVVEETMEVAGMTIRIAVLNDGRCIINAEDVERILAVLDAVWLGKEKK